MNYRIYFLILGLAFLVACGDNIEKRVVASYESGIPAKVEYYRVDGDSEEMVKHVRFYENGEKKEEGSFDGTQRDGHWTYWHQNGNKWSEGDYKKGVRHGESTVWFDNGKVRFTGQYFDGEMDGTWTYYAVDGAKVKDVIFSKGKKIEEISFE